MSGNKQLTFAISDWVFGEKGQLQVKSVKHHKVGETLPPQAYTVMDDVVSSYLNLAPIARLT